MTRSRTARFLALLISLVLIASACSSRSDDKADSSSGDDTATTAPGVTGGDTGGDAGKAPSINTDDCGTDPSEEIKGDTIKLVSSYPQSGLTAAFAEIAGGWKAFFQYTNAQGGVEINGKKYKIETADKDDEYNAQKSATNIEELAGVDGSKAFGVFSVVGTANNIAIRDSLGDNCVPNLFAATGSPAWGNPDYPWLIGSTLAPYTLEGHAFADYLKNNKPEAKTIAMLVQDDDFGQAYEQGLKQAIEGTDLKVVKVEKYPTGANEVKAQMTSLAASNADAFFDGATLLACPDALKNAQAAKWKPVTWVSGTCISKTLMGIAGDAAQGALSMTNVKDPFNPMFAEGADMKLYREQVGKYSPDADPDNGIVAYGWTQGALLVEAMKKAKTASRLGVMDSIRNLDDVHAGLLLDDVGVKTGPDDEFMGETVQVVQYDATKKYFDNVGKELDFEGKTSELTPKDLITG